MRNLYRCLIVTILFAIATIPCSGNSPERFNTLVTTILQATGGKLINEKLINTNAPENVSILLPLSYNKFEVFKNVYSSVINCSDYQHLQPWKLADPNGLYISYFRIKENDNKALCLAFFEQYDALSIVEIEVDSQIRNLFSSSEFPTIFNFFTIRKYIEDITWVTGGYVIAEHIENINDEEYVLTSSIQLCPDTTFENLIKNLTLLDFNLLLSNYRKTFGWVYVENFWFVNYTLDGECLDRDDYVTPYISIKYIPENKLINIIFSRTKSKSN